MNSCLPLTVFIYTVTSGFSDFAGQIYLIVGLVVKVAVDLKFIKLDWRLEFGIPYQDLCTS